MEKQRERERVGEENELNKPLPSAAWWKEEFHPAAQNTIKGGFRGGPRVPKPPLLFL